MAVVPFNPYVVHARRAAKEAQARAAAVAREQVRQRAKLPEPPAPPLPKLRVNLSPAAAIRTLCQLGLGVAISATIATTLTALAGADATLGPSGVERLTSWMASLPWLFLALSLVAISSIERLVQRRDSRAWLGLALSTVVLAACQALGGVLIDTVSPLVRVGVFITVLGIAGLALREFFSTESGNVRLQIVGGVVGGFAVAAAPFRLLGQAVLPAPEHTHTLAALLAGCDALLGLVVATLTVHATLVYVRDFLPDFTIALDTADEPASPVVRTPAAK